MRGAAFALLLGAIVVASASVAGAENSSGLTLIETAGARPAALGEAYTASSNDIAGFHYNPASLQTLEHGQATFSYQEGLIEDSFGRLMLGMPLRNAGLGVSIGYYDGGDFEINGGGRSESVTAQRDISVALGGAKALGRWSAGLTGKYLSSEILEQDTARAFVADFGLGLVVSDRLRLGVAAQNFGSRLSYADSSAPLPRLIRAGGSASLSSGRFPTRLFADATHLLNEGETVPSLGLEIMAGALALRGGFRREAGLNNFSAGTGFAFGRTTLDYSFVMASEVDVRQRISLAFAFGGPAKAAPFVRRETAPAAQVRPVAPAAARSGRTVHTLEGEKIIKSSGRLPRTVYVVKPGDTLASIAKARYGDARLWKTIYQANLGLLEDPTDVKAGTRIILP